MTEILKKIENFDRKFEKIKNQFLKFVFELLPAVGRHAPYHEKADGGALTFVRKIWSKILSEIFYYSKLFRT